MNNEQVGHAFAYDENGRGSSFESRKTVNEKDESVTVLYSYDSILAVKNGNTILVSNRIANYSNTSQRHASHFRGALSGYENVIYINGEISSWNTFKAQLNEKKLNDTNDTLLYLHTKQKKARSRDYSYEINDTLKNGDLIVKHGKIRKNSKILKLFNDFKSNTDLSVLIEKAEKAEKAQNLKRANLNYKRNLEKLEAFTGVSLKGYSKTDINNHSFLKIEGDEVKTSNYARVPLKDARLLYIAYKRGMKLTGQKVGHYTVLKADKKTLVVGCHKLLFKDINRILGVQNDT